MAVKLTDIDLTDIEQISDGALEVIFVKVKKFIIEMAIMENYLMLNVAVDLLIIVLTEKIKREQSK